MLPISIRYIPEYLSLGGLMYCFRHFNRTVAPYWKMAQTCNDITPLTPYLRYFNYYNSVNTNYTDDWQRIINLHHNNVYKNKSSFICSFRDNMMDDIYSTFYNGYNEYFDDSHSYDAIHAYAKEAIMAMKFNIDNYVERREAREAVATNEPHYESIQLDNNEIYNLRLVYIPEGTRTSIHNHGGVCFYKLLNHDIDVSATETRYAGYAHNAINTGQQNTMHKNSVIIDHGNINVLFTDEYHEIASINGDACLLNLYFHNVHITDNNYVRNTTAPDAAVFGNRRNYDV